MFPGDLIIAVDNVDTRSMSADHVLEIIQGKANLEKEKRFCISIHENATHFISLSFVDET